MAWSDERRARQAALIRTWRPWLSSTGPRSEQGKARSSRNADKGLGTAEIREARRILNLLIRATKQSTHGKT